LSHLKLQKLRYYAQAWHLAFHDYFLFDGKFQAWGPRPRPVASFTIRFLGPKSLLFRDHEEDIPQGVRLGAGVGRRRLSHINSILEVYAALVSTQLEEMTHHEDRGSRRGRVAAERAMRARNQRAIDDYVLQATP